MDPMTRSGGISKVRRGTASHLKREEGNHTAPITTRAPQAPSPFLTERPSESESAVDDAYLSRGSSGIVSLREESLRDDSQAGDDVPARRLASPTCKLIAPRVSSHTTRTDADRDSDPKVGDGCDFRNPRPFRGRGSAASSDDSSGSPSPLPGGVSRHDTPLNLLLNLNLLPEAR